MRSDPITQRTGSLISDCRIGEIRILSVVSFTCAELKGSFLDLCTSAGGNSVGCSEAPILVFRRRCAERLVEFCWNHCDHHCTHPLPPPFPASAATLLRPCSCRMRSTLQNTHLNYGTHCSKWECSHRLQATSKGLHANLCANLLMHPVWTGPKRPKPDAHLAFSASCWGKTHSQNRQLCFTSFVLLTINSVSTDLQLQWLHLLTFWWPANWNSVAALVFSFQTG